jgi:hypothetical protein
MSKPITERIKKLVTGARNSLAYWKEMAALSQADLDAAKGELSRLQSRLAELDSLDKFIYRLTLDLQKHRALTDAQKDDLFQQAYRFYVARNCDRFDSARSAGEAP